MSSLYVRLKFYEPDLSSNIEPMVYVNYCEKEELANPRCQKLSDLDSRTAQQDKEWYAERNPRTNEPTMTAQMFFTIYYAEKATRCYGSLKVKLILEQEMAVL